jgi:hypothetical protein
MVEYSNFITHIQDYMFNNEMISKCIETNNTMNANTTTFFIPNDKDTLFWCFYIIKNGISKYTELQNRNYIIEKKLKIEYVERIKKNKQLLKNHKFSALTNIEDMLVNKQIIDLNTFFSLCVLEELNVFYINKRTFFELNINTTDKIYILKYIPNKRIYGFEETNNADLTEFREKYFKINKLDKPIKTFTSYKTDEIIEICQKLEINIYKPDTHKPKNKKELYEMILQNI